MLHFCYHDGVNEQTDHDGWRRKQNVIDKADDLSQPGLTPILRQVDTRHNAERGTKHGRPQNQQTATGQGVRQTTTRRIRRRRHFGEQR